MSKLLTVEGLAEEIGEDPESWAGRCHEISLAIIRSDLFQSYYPREEHGSRVARGFVEDYAGQHSWISVDGSPYDPEGLILDPTLSVLLGHTPELIWCTLEDSDYGHKPHGMGNIFMWGKPVAGPGEIVELDDSDLSEEAKEFLDFLGPLDYQGWAMLFTHAPVGGWPAAEIIDTAYRDPNLRATIPMDRAGMLTDHNPSDCYW